VNSFSSYIIFFLLPVTVYLGNGRNTVVRGVMPLGRLKSRKMASGASLFDEQYPKDPKDLRVLDPLKKKKKKKSTNKLCNSKKINTIGS
jgi:hypothetical protein